MASSSPSIAPAPHWARAQASLAAALDPFGTKRRLGGSSVRLRAPAPINVGDAGDSGATLASIGGNHTQQNYQSGHGIGAAGAKLLKHFLGGANTPGTGAGANSSKDLLTSLGGSGPLAAFGNGPGSNTLKSFAEASGASSSASASSSELGAFGTIAGYLGWADLGYNAIKGHNKGGLGDAAQGALAGAGAGTTVLPGFGTLIGGVAGFVGGFFGLW